MKLHARDDHPHLPCSAAAEAGTADGRRSEPPFLGTGTYSGKCSAPSDLPETSDDRSRDREQAPVLSCLPQRVAVLVLHLPVLSAAGRSLPAVPPRRRLP